MAATKGDSRTNIMDAAETLFSEQGFDATTTRDIARKSGDTLGTLSYHFGNKAALLREIFGRRFAAVANKRQEYYRAATEGAQDGNPDLAAVVEAIALPFIDLVLTGEEGWQNYIVLLGRTRECGNADQEAFFLEIVDAPMRECLTWLAAAAPDASLAQLIYAYEFASMIAINECSRVAQRRLASFAGNDDLTLRGVRDEMTRFITAGVAAVLRVDGENGGVCVTGERGTSSMAEA